MRRIGEALQEQLIDHLEIVRRESGSWAVWSDIAGIVFAPCLTLWIQLVAAD